ncbi:MAG TPA: sugar ABC transporter substrate-binding protein [Gammaproteobacteria bacterium]|nr:sugar ABC transporter substrate-binding protein [Gammaproteobacteria bacterium]
MGLCALGLTACASKFPPLPPALGIPPSTSDPQEYTYLVGPGDSLNIFVWRNPEVSQSVSVRPDGKITTPLVEDLSVSGKTPTQVARDIEVELSKYIKDPIVTVIMGGFAGPYSEQVRVVGEAARPQALPYRQYMTLLDVMIAVGGLTDFADGNGASIVRFVNGERKQYGIRIDDLLKDGDIDANVDILPGDTLIIPEAWF